MLVFRVTLFMKRLVATCEMDILLTLLMVSQTTTDKVKSINLEFSFGRLCLVSITKLQ